MAKKEKKDKKEKKEQPKNKAPLIVRQAKFEDIPALHALSAKVYPFLLPKRCCAGR